MSDTIVVNLFGGPGSGKSTIAAGIYYNLKKDQINCELVREYVKKWAWEGILPKKLDQLYITGKQSKAEHELYGKVKFIVTDCPLYMGMFYERKYFDMRVVSEAVRQFYDHTKNITRRDFVVSRAKEYNPAGRFCSEDKANEMDDELLDFLRDEGVAYTQLHGTIDEQVNDVLRSIRHTDKLMGG